MPYKDADKQRDAMRKIMRVRRKRRREFSKAVLLKIQALPEFQAVSKTDQKIIVKGVASVLEEIEKQIPVFLAESHVELEEVVPKLRMELDQYLKVLLSQYVKILSVKRRAAEAVKAIVEGVRA